MEVILLEKVSKLGDIGQTVNVKPGYARNFLFPNKIAIRATKENKEVFEKQLGQAPYQIVHRTLSHPDHTHNQQ